MSTPDHISTPPDQAYQPYDATDDGPVGPWETLPEGGGFDRTGVVDEPFGDAGPWRQV